MLQEIWKEIPGFDGRYEVSDQGRVRSWYYRKGGRRQEVPHYVSFYSTKVGYLQCKLWDGEVVRSQLMHRLVMLAFVGPSHLEVNHRDGDKTNNHLSNLEYTTHRENCAHARDVLGRWQGVRAVALPTARDREIRLMAAEGMSQRKIAENFGISQPYVFYIVSGKIRPEIH